MTAERYQFQFTPRRANCEVVVAHFTFGPQRCEAETNYQTRDDVGVVRAVCERHMQELGGVS